MKTTEQRLQIISEILNGPINEIAQELGLRIDHDDPFWADLERDILREMRRQNAVMTAQTHEEYVAAKSWYPTDHEDRHWDSMATHLERFSG